MCVIKKKKIDRAYEFKSRDAMLSFVTGRLKRALHEWKLIYVAQFIIEVIEFGYKLPFIHIPSPKDFVLFLGSGVRLAFSI